MAQQRKKQPALVRKQLLEAGTAIAIQHGLSAVTVQAVADKAGVTKGGFLHHFPSKRHLLLAIFNDLLASIERELNQYMEDDAEEYGRFTRAYIKFSLASALDGLHDKRTALAVLSISDSELRSLWADWLNELQSQHAETDGDEHLSLIRLTADGVWMAALSDITLPAMSSIRRKLLNATRISRQKKAPIGWGQRATQLEILYPE